jgi:hypothetical protein
MEVANMTFAYIIVASLVAMAIFFGVRFFLRSSEKFGGSRVIVCPETGKQAMVEVDTRRAALTSLVGQTEIRLESCWRWPLNEGCGQECLRQLDVAPDDCLVRSVLTKWYRGQKCVFCKRRFGEIDLLDHRPDLFTPEGITVEWTDVPIAAVKEAMATYQPVCWNCHIAQTFYHEHVDLVVERPVM